MEITKNDRINRQVELMKSNTFENQLRPLEVLRKMELVIFEEMYSLMKEKGLDLNYNEFVIYLMDTFDEVCEKESDATRTLKELGLYETVMKGVTE